MAEINEALESRHKYVQIFINEKKYCKDVLLFPRMAGMVILHSLDSMLFYKMGNESDEKNNTQTVLIAGLR